MLLVMVRLRVMVVVEVLVREISGAFLVEVVVFFECLAVMVVVMALLVIGVVGLGVAVRGGGE